MTKAKWFVSFSESASRIVCALVVTGVVTGCGGSRTKVHLDNARYPVSMSPVMIDRDGTHVNSSGLVTVGKFQASTRGWSIGWTAIPLNTIDFSTELNQQVESAKGEAVINFKVMAAHPLAPDVFPGYFFLHWLPIWPGSVAVEAQGDIVRSMKSPALPVATSGLDQQDMEKGMNKPAESKTSLDSEPKVKKKRHRKREQRPWDNWDN